MSTATKTITLYCTDNGSDKVYTAAIESREGGFVVSYMFGPRGGRQTPGIHKDTKVPVTAEKAEKVYATLVRQKMAKGYTPGEDGTPFMATDMEERFTGILPQLLNAIEEEDLDRYFDDPDFVAQEKYDGQRVTLRRENSQVYGINRKGLTIPLPETVGGALLSIEPAGDLTLDAELIGSIAYVFDCRLCQHGNMEGFGYADRDWRLHEMIGDEPEGPLVRVYSADTPALKRLLFQQVKARRGEGIVFKDKHARYTAGRPNSGGPQLKFKFTQMATCVAGGENGNKRSVKIAVLDNGIREVGKVTIPANHEVPPIGALVEVRYLYVGTKGSLYQAVYLGVREDKSEPDTYASLKQKPSNEDDDEA